jgi:putative transposase
MERRIAKAQRELSRKCKGSNNRRKAKMRVAKLHMKARNIRNWWLHDLTTRLVRDYRYISIEHLEVQKMMRNKYVAKSIGDTAFYEFRRMMEYKCAEYGRELTVADKGFPSTEICSNCGHRVEKMPMYKRAWVCPTCGMSHDRDVNAAINLENYAVKSTVSACGGKVGKGLAVSTAGMTTAPLKQETTFVAIGGV